MRVRISNVNLAKVDIFGNAKKVSAEIMISNHEESIVCVRISNRILREIYVFLCFLSGYRIGLLVREFLDVCNPIQYPYKKERKIQFSFKSYSKS